MHRCSSLACVNPDHLFVGKLHHAETMKSSGRKGNYAITPDDAVAIAYARRLGESRATIAARYGVSMSVVTSITKGHNWKIIGLEAMPDGRRVLTGEDVTRMRAAYAAGESYKSIARSYGVSYGTARLAIRRDTWKHVP